MMCRSRAPGQTRNAAWRPTACCALPVTAPARTAPGPSASLADHVSLDVETAGHVATYFVEMAAAPVRLARDRSRLRPAEARSRATVDRQLVACGYVLQSHDETNLDGSQRVAVRESTLAPRQVWADSWARDASLDDPGALPALAVRAADIVEELEFAVAEFSELAESLPLDAFDHAGGGARS